MTVDEAKKILLAANLSKEELFALKFLILEVESHFESLPDEIWRDIADYEGRYQVSNFARVRSLRKDKIKIIKPDIVHTGYLRVKLHKKGKTKKYYVHVLVARTFIPNPENKSQVNHIDGNKFNNCLENLEWVTCQENILHSFKMGLSKTGCEHGRSKLEEWQIREVRTKCIPGDPELGFRAFAEKFGVTHKIISDAYYYRSYKEIE